jgi:hypothetical protein
VRRQALSKDSAADWIFVRDWIGELANQVLGRIKNRLHPYGISFDVSPPAALSGSMLAFAAPKGPRPRVYMFVAGAKKVWFCIDAIYDANAMVSLEGGTEEGPREGGIVEL